MNIIEFGSEQFGALRTVESDGRVYFCGRDVATALGYVNTKDAIARHCKGVVKRYPLTTAGGTQEVRFISEGDLYRLVASSKLESAQKFETWVFDEVLPAIRRDGGYMTTSPDETPEETMARAVLIAERTIERQRRQIAAMQTHAKIGRAISDEDGLITVTEAARYIASLNPLVRRHHLTDFLRDRELMCKASTAPTRRAIDQGCMKQVASPPIQHSDGTITRQAYGKLTAKGLALLVREFA
ncbi:phage antirepressor KilAC domain-containing protein [Collinsella sp. AGMB00827]|uniref:Phage antirepressor KilAC domain-containing protein n=1 Tax=Collinsella ureilytica TaxID=2869515 RepID=A0ABS7MPM3_9ACTN|nr:BRO family protein [Collinsella urealyticum]MBY4798320.1 phage antirepressor KilAC domain-containing protein [Collinsella urealyticum]